MTPSTARVTSLTYTLLWFSGTSATYSPTLLCAINSTSGYDSRTMFEAALRGEEVRITRLQCPACIDELLGQLVDIMAAEDPQLREMFALLDQGVEPDDLPGYLKGEDERGLARLFGFLDKDPGEES